MHIDVRLSGEVVVVELQGKLSAGLGDQILRETFAELLDSGHRRLLLDLSQVSFIDSAGVGELVAGLRAARRVGGDVKLLNASERVHSTLYIARLLPLFELHRDEASAVRSFA
jgi:anti-sigma B factor antagonist